jgi:hypothetical protein
LKFLIFSRTLICGLTGTLAPFSPAKYIYR